ncbi:hypothetical protein BSF38_02948 [Paludisphaera borealis]|uniref:Uncharacterized protein n=2 Tax=Paludisphaera borealis TaxID=1387353 RepID=A0A1U7CR58_9BACT|nr:hypothetical protein BSF38_02948 [Paludisphaera borealis]
MSTCPFIMALTIVSAAADDGIHDVRALVAAMEALQRPVADFRCEFEGTKVAKGEGADADEDFKLKTEANGLYDTFGGVFVWKQGGEMNIDALHRRAVDNIVSRELVLVRPREREVESHTRSNTTTIGHTEIRKLDHVPVCMYDSPAMYFLIDEIKRCIDLDFYKTSIANDQIEGRPVKALTVFLTFKGPKEIPDQLLMRYWIDLHKSGQVVRKEYYQDDVLGSRCEITLRSFKVGSEDVWMPVSADIKSYVKNVNGKPAVFKDPVLLQSIYAIDGIMQFNKHPGPDVFTAKYKPGTPISDHVRKLKYQFDEEKISPRPTMAETEAMLHSQLAKAEAQKNELVAAPLSEGFNWWSLSVAGMGAAVLASLAALWMQRRAG